MFDKNILWSSGDMHHNSLTPIINVNNDTRVNIQFKGHLVYFSYSERIYALCGSEFF